MPKVLQGKIISTKMAKTVVIEVERVFRHRLYKKTLRRHKKHKAHNEKFDLKEGDIVRIQECRPISKEKHFKVIEKLSK